MIWCMSDRERTPKDPGWYPRWGAIGLLVAVVLGLAGAGPIAGLLGLIALTWLCTGLWRLWRIHRWVRDRGLRP